MVCIERKMKNKGGLAVGKNDDEAVCLPQYFGCLVIRRVVVAKLCEK
jgi:hypothetical protein